MSSYHIFVELDNNHCQVLKLPYFQEQAEISFWCLSAVSAFNGVSNNGFHLVKKAMCYSLSVLPQFPIFFHFVTYTNLLVVLLYKLDTYTNLSEVFLYKLDTQVMAAPAVIPVKHAWFIQYNNYVLSRPVSSTVSPDVSCHTIPVKHAWFIQYNNYVLSRPVSPTVSPDVSCHTSETCLVYSVQ